MRFELKYTGIKSIKAAFKSELIVRDLSSIDINLRLSNLWYESYSAIRKQTSLEFNLTDGDLTRDMVNKMARAYIDHLGGANTVMEILKRSPCFINTRPENRCRLKNKIKEISSISTLTNEAPLLSELNEAITNLFNDVTKTNRVIH